MNGVMRAMLFLLVCGGPAIAAAPTKTETTDSRAYSVLDLPENIEACSRAQSRVARDIAKQKIVSPAKLNGGVMHQACPFHSSLDMYLDHETVGKQVNYRGQYMCTYSKKLFRNERYVDLHLHRFWSSKLVGGNSAVCLAEWCDVLSCNNNVNDVTNSLKLRRSIDHRCRAVMHACFPPSLAENNIDVQHMLIRSVCSEAEHLLSGKESIESIEKVSLVQSASASLGAILWYTMAIVATCSTIIFYVCHYLQRWGAVVRPDLVNRGYAAKSRSKGFKQW